MYVVKRGEMNLLTHSLPCVLLKKLVLMHITHLHAIGHLYELGYTVDLCLVVAVVESLAVQ
jgi:hypothetical protein